MNSDLAFQGDFAFVGNFNGFNIYDISNPASPALRTSVVCPGGQGDVSVYGNLLFMSVEENRAKIDCSSTPPADATTRFRGVRIFDISNIDSPRHVAGVQTCRGSHTHTLVTDDDDPANVYIYVQGTAGVRPATELAGCDGNNTNTPTGENPSKWRIEVIKVPVAAPQDATIVSTPRLFADPGTGAVNGLQNEVPTPQHPSGMNWGPTPITDACHDITVYPEIELAAGACEGNGILIDISDPANPTRIDSVADPLYSYWHGATFSNDGKTVMFTDEWGGGTSRALPRDRRPQVGRQRALQDRQGRAEVPQLLQGADGPDEPGELRQPHPVAGPGPGPRHLRAGLVPGRGVARRLHGSRRIPSRSATTTAARSMRRSLVLGGLWSTYYYNGNTFGSEIARGFDVFGFTPTAQLSQNEIDAAAEVQADRLNVQHQDRIVWEPSFAVVRAFVDQAARAGALSGAALDEVNGTIDEAEALSESGDDAGAVELLSDLADELRPNRPLGDVVEGLDDLADSLD